MIARVLKRAILPKLAKGTNFKKITYKFPQSMFLVRFNAYQFSSELYSKEDYYETVKNYKEILEHNQNDLSTIYDLAIIYYNHKGFIQAVPLFQKCIELDPTYSPAYTHLAKIYLEQGLVEDTINILNQNLVYHINNIESLVMLGQIDLQAKKYDEAIEKFKNCITINKEFCESNLYLGICYRKIHENEISLKYLKEYIEKGNDPSEGYNELGLTYEQIHDYEKAAKCFEKGLELNPSNFKAYKNLTLTLIDLKKYEKANALMKKIPKELENDFEFVAAQGYMLEVKGRIDEAVAYYEKLTQKFEKDFNLYLSLGNCYFRLGLFEKAEEQYHKGLGLKPEYFYYGLAEICKVKKDYAQAITYYENVIDIEHDNINAYLSISEIFQLTGQISEAITYIYQALEIVPNNLQINLKIAKLEYSEGNVEVAAQIIKNCIEIAPQEADLYYQYGSLLMEMEEVEEGEAYFKKCLSLNPHHPLLQRFAAELKKRETGVDEY